MPIDDDDDYWAARMNMSSADHAAMRDQAEQNARDAYDADTRAMAAGDDVADGRADDGGRVGKFATGVQAQMGRLMAQRIAAVDSGDGAGLPLRGMLPLTLPGPVPEPPPGCIVWPLPGHTQINTRKLRSNRAMVTLVGSEPTTTDRPGGIRVSTLPLHRAPRFWLRTAAVQVEPTARIQTMANEFALRAPLGWRPNMRTSPSLA